MIEEKLLLIRFGMLVLGLLGMVVFALLIIVVTEMLSVLDKRRIERRAKREGCVPRRKELDRPL